MSTNSSAHPSNRGLRFPLWALLALITCVCCLLGGHILGKHAARAELLNQLSTSTKSYHVGDVLLDPNSNQYDFDRLIATIERDCSPGVWQRSGGNSQIASFPLNISLVVSTNEIVHEEVKALLERLRAERF